MIIDGKFYNYKKNDGCGYDEILQTCIEETCQYCIDNTFLNSEDKINKPIMMLGKIQSGKTRAFTGLIALAFDNSFDMVFILTKNSTALVQQTVSRMKKEFKPFINNHEVVVGDIIKKKSKISGYELKQKNIIVAKKQKDNLNKIISFIENYAIVQKKNCLVIDDEADTTGIGYGKIKGSDDFTLRTVSSKVNELRGTLDGCVFIEVTATPYALYLQPEFGINDIPHPIKPLKTVLVPSGEGYIGGKEYFIESKDEESCYSYLFTPMSQDECDLVSVQKRKGKKSRIEDQRVFKKQEILFKDKIPVFKKGLINFIIGAIALRKIYGDENHYSYVIHTATQKNSHENLQDVVEFFLQQIAERDNHTKPTIEKMFEESYYDIKKSVEAHNFLMPTYEEIRDDFYNYIDNEYYSVDVVNSDKAQDIGLLLDEETGELNPQTPLSIFVGGSVLDRGITIPNMIGFYYARNPKTMQQDTVLQHSRMFGYRKKLLPVTRFYTTERIYSNMVKITEIDIALREDIENGKQGNGVYFITNYSQDKSFGSGSIKPCSPDKIRISDVILLKPNKRLLPVGFEPIIKSEYSKHTNKINKMLNNDEEYFHTKIQLDVAIKLIETAYLTIIPDEDTERFISCVEFITSLRYMMGSNNELFVVVKRNKKDTKIRPSGRLTDAPDNGEQVRALAVQLAETMPVIVLLNETKEDESWKYRSFWWPILVAPKNVPKTMYAAKIAGEKLV